MQWCSQRFDGGGCGGDGDDGGNGEGKNIMMIDTNNHNDDDNSSDKKNLWRRAEPSRNILFQLCLLPHTHIFPERTVDNEDGDGDDGEEGDAVEDEGRGCWWW